MSTTTRRRGPNGSADLAPWVNHENALVIDGAAWSINAGSGGFLDLKDFQFTRADIPDRARVIGIEIYAVGAAVNPLGQTFRSRLLGLAITDGEHSDDVLGTVENRRLPPFLAGASGSPTWGNTLTGPDITGDPTFGIRLRQGIGGDDAQVRLVDGAEIAIAWEADGFEYHPQVRLSPANGADEVLDLVDLLTDAIGPTKESVDYRADMGARENINRGIEVARHGFRPRVRLTCQILTMADEATIKKILNAFAAFDVRVFLSMDDGATEREVYLRKIRGPKPLGKKTGIGVEWVLDLEAVAPLSELLASDGAGAW